MAITPSYPGVYVEELPSPVHSIAAVATSIAAFIGYTARGIDHRAERILSFSDYERLFGGIAADSELSYAVQQFFTNGGAQAYVVRVPRTGASGATASFSNLQFTALSSGAWANGNLLVDIDYVGVDQTTEPTAFNLTVTNLDDGTSEVFSSVSLNAAKSSYVIAVLNDPDTGSQLVNVKTIGALGSVPPAQTGTVGKALTAAAVNAALAVGGGNLNAKADFGIRLSVSQPSTVPSPLPIDVKILATGTPVPQTVAGLAAQLERAINAALIVKWPGASVKCGAVPVGGGQGIRVAALLPDIADAILTFAAPTTAGLTDASTALALATPDSAVVSHHALGSGHGWATQTPGSDGTALPGTADLIGDQLTFKGIYALDKVDLFNLMSIPDATRANPGNPNALDTSVDPNAIYAAAISYCRSRRALLLIDPPPAVNNVSAAVDWKATGLAVHDENGAAFFPRLRLPDPANNYQLRTFAPSGLVAGLYARIDGSRGVWKAPAGIEATLTGVQAAVYKLTDAENGVLNPLGLNCFRIFPVYGPVLWGARTLVGADADANQWKYVPVRRTALFIEESLYRGTQWAVFEPNDEPLWAQLRLNIESFMHTLFRKGAFQGSTPAEAYLVKCDKDTTTQADIDQGVVNVLVGFAPLKPAEFVVIQIQQLAGQVQS
jgi:phage tail sheath protein FI